MSISWVCCQSKMGAPLIAFCALKRAQGTPSVFSFGCLFSRLKMQKTIHKDTRWREGEGERRDTKDCIFDGKSKETTRSEMNREEGETKQGAKKMALSFLYPLSLVSPFPLSFRNEKNKKEEL